MSDERWHRMMGLFHEALEREPGERESFVRERCAGDEELFDRILAMLRSHEDQTDSFLEPPPPPAPEPGSWDSDMVHDLDPFIGRTIGHYRVLRRIGLGGMGAVYEAEQSHPRRRVALKVMKQGVAAHSAMRRFEFESQILARLRHPNIAQVYEAGTHDDGSGSVPFFALEYIPNAKPITHDARERELTTRERLQLFVKVCEAVHHGHQKGIIHRDLKPGNILIDPSLGEPKVIDFGVARATDSDMAVTTLQTGVGQLIGTLQYMSPEQCDADPHDLDTRSDVYALGVVLYELICDQLPYDLSASPVYEAARIIREASPPRPSSFNRTLRGDLETIALKALEKDRDRRYRSAADLGSDITRYLNNEPIIARPPSMVYHIRTFARRNRTLVGGVAATFVVLLAALTVSSTMYMQTEQARAAEADQRRIAEKREGEAIAAREAEAEQRRLAEERGREAVEAAERAEREAARAAAEAERALASQQEAMQRAEEVEKVAAFQESQLAEIDTALMGSRLRQNIADKRRAALIGAGHDEDGVEQMLRQLDDALDGVNFTNIALEALDENIFERALAAIDEQFDDQPLVKARLLQTLARTMRVIGLLDRANTPQEQALAIRRDILGEHRDTLVSISEMGVLLEARGRLDKAEPFYLEAWEGRRRLLGDEDPHTLTSINNLAYLLWRQGRLVEAEPYWRQALEVRRSTLGDSHPDTLISLSGLGTLLLQQDKLAEAKSHYLEALDGFRRVLGNEHPDTLTLMSNLGLLLHRMGRLDDAEPYRREVLEISRRVLGDEHAITLNALNSLGYLLHEQGRPEEAERHFKEALATYRRVLGDEHYSTLASLNNLAGLLTELGRLEEAEALSAEALQTARRVFPEGHWQLGVFAARYARTLSEIGRFEEAEPLMLEAHETFENALGPDHDHTARVSRALAGLYKAWHEAAPKGGYDARADHWSARLQSDESGRTPGSADSTGVSPAIGDEE